MFNLADLTTELEALTGLCVDVISAGGLRSGTDHIEEESGAS